VIWLKHVSPFIIISSALGLIMMLFIVIPIFGSVASSAPGLPTALTNQTAIKAILTSFYCALLATIFMFALGIPFAYLFAKYEFPGKKIMDSLIDLPILIPHNAAGTALLLVLTPASPIGSFFNSIGIRFQESIFGIVVAMAFVSSPFMIRSAQEAFASINPAMEQTARSLGATNFKAFANVTFPLALKGILTGCMLTWARAVSEFGAVVMLAYFPFTAPTYLNDLWNGGQGGLSAVLPVTGLLILLSVVILVVFRVVASRPIRPVY
jgi:molybdate/tungstate transport system permease protein